MSALTSQSLAVITASNNEEVLRKNLLRSPMLRDGGVEIIIERDCPCAGLAFNRAMDRSQASIFVIAHQDVYLPEGWDEKLHRAVAKLEETNRQWAVLGVWGVDEHGQFSGRVWCTGGNREYSSPPANPAEIISLDEIVVVLKRSANLRFDEKLPGFHLYGTDIVRQAMAHGFKAYAFDGPVVHNSRPNPQPMNRDYFAAHRYLRHKWSRELPLRTCVAPVTRWGIALRMRWLRRELRNLRGYQMPEDRADSPQRLAVELGYETDHHVEAPAS